MTVILTSLSLAWICSICIPWGRGSNGLLSITTSFLCQNSRTSSSGEQCIISSPSPINLSSSCFTKVGHEPMYIKSLLPDKSLTGDVLDLRSYRCGSSVVGACQEQATQPAQCPLYAGCVAPALPGTPLMR